MGSDGAGCTDFGVSRQGELTNILGSAGLTCLQNKALTTMPGWAAYPGNRIHQSAAFNLKNHKAISQSGKKTKESSLPVTIRHRTLFF
jgi:hypothetical protein